MDIKPSTKLILDKSGNNKVICVALNTPECRIHNNKPYCYECPIYEAQLARLHAYETLHMMLEESFAEDVD